MIARTDSGAFSTASSGIGWGDVVFPVLLKLALDGHERIEGSLTGLAPRPPRGSARIERWQDSFSIRRPPVLLAHRQPGEPEAVLQQPLDHVPLGEHLRLGRDLVRLDLAAAVDLGVERLAVRVVPVLVDPPQRRIVGPRGGELRNVEPLDYVTEGCWRDREQPGEPNVAVEAREVGRQLLEEELEQRRVTFRVVSGERRTELTELPVALAIPTAREHHRLGQPLGLEQSKEHEAVDERGRRLLLRPPEETLLGRTPLRLVLRLRGSGACIDPRLDPLASSSVRLIEPGLRDRNSEPIPSIRLVVNRAKQQRAEALLRRLLRPSNRFGEELLGVRGDHSALRAGS